MPQMFGKRRVDRAAQTLFEIRRIPVSYVCLARSARKQSMQGAVDNIATHTRCNAGFDCIGTPDPEAPINECSERLDSLSLYRVSTASYDFVRGDSRNRIIRHNCRRVCCAILSGMPARISWSAIALKRHFVEQTAGCHL